MNYNILTIEPFDRQLKKLSKKYPFLKGEIKQLTENLKENPFRGDPLANSCYKVRLAIASKGKGKRGGARVITHLQVVGQTVYLLAIYDKSEADTIAENQIVALLNQID
jgi:mRNA-degrading endonuclease RelE of RelBE toxin-antitoxin system